MIMALAVGGSSVSVCCQTQDVVVRGKQIWIREREWGAGDYKSCNIAPGVCFGRLAMTQR